MKKGSCVHVQKPGSTKMYCGSDLAVNGDINHMKVVPQKAFPQNICAECRKAIIIETSSAAKNTDKTKKYIDRRPSSNCDDKKQIFRQKY